MKPYKVFLRLEAVEALRATRLAQRHRIGRFIDSSADNPSQRGEYVDKDDTDRQIEVKVIGRFAITFWADHAVREVKITDIRRADRP